MWNVLGYLSEVCRNKLNNITIKTAYWIIIFAFFEKNKKIHLITRVYVYSMSVYYIAHVQWVFFLKVQCVGLGIILKYLYIHDILYKGK